MKLLLGTLILSATASVFAQDAGVAPAKARIAIDPTIATDIIVAGVSKNAPFTADESGETVRILPDGNRVVENWTGKIARNSQGRIRREVTSGTAHARPIIFGASVNGLMPGVLAGGAGTVSLMSKIDAERLAAPRALITTEGTTLTTVGGSGEGRTIVISKRDAETAAQGAVVAASGGTVISTGEGRQVILSKTDAGAAPVAIARAAVEAEMAAVAMPVRIEPGKFQTRRESLGSRDFGGVQAEGTRVTVTIAAGAVGNDREIEITTETWVSKELGVTVYSKTIDPRHGESTYQLTNIVRAEPDASLFPVK